MLKKVLVAVVILVGVFVLVLYPKVYVLRGSAGGSLYWNANEALLFMGGGTSGARMSYPRYALEPFLVGMGDVRPPDDEACSQILVIRVTDKVVQRYDTGVDCVAAYDVFESHIYAVSWPKLWKWSGTRLETATPEELRAFDSAQVAARNCPRFS